MPEVRETSEFKQWIRGLRDANARARVIVRIDRFRRGAFGDVKPVGDGVSEARIDYGPGYRVYFVQRGETVVVLLCGGDKDSQAADIEHAKALAATLEP